MDPYSMTKLAALKEQRAAKTDTLRAIVAKAEAENRNLTDAEQSAFDAGKSDVEKIERDIRNAEFLAEIERRADAEPLSPRGDSMAALERRFQVGKAIAEFSESGRLTGAEAEWSQEHRSGRSGAIAMPTSVFLGESRAVTVGGTGGNLVQTDLGPTIDRLRPVLAIESMGATVLRGLTGNLDLPRLTASGTSGWVAEGGSATGSDPTFDKVSMAPKTVTARYEMSRRLMIQAPQIDALLRADIGFLLAQALDSAAIQGGGTNEPTGILANGSVNVVSLGTNGAALTIDTAADLMGAVDDANATGATGFLTNTKVRKAAMKLKDANNIPYLLDQVVFKEQPVTYSNNVPSNLTKGTGTNLSAILYGVWSDLILGYWSSVDIVLNPYHSGVADKGGAYLYAFLDADIALRHPTAFAVCKDVVTA